MLVPDPRRFYPRRQEYAELRVIERVERRPVRQPVHGSDEVGVVTAVRRVEKSPPRSARRP